MLETGGIRLNLAATEPFLSAAELDELAVPVAHVVQALEEGKTPGSEFLGWLDLPVRIGEADLEAIEAEAARVRDFADVWVVVGIGGSYLGARAVLEALGGPAAGSPEILFAGTGLCSVALQDTLRRLQDREFGICIISKSGTTLEPAVAFRMLRSELVRRWGADEAAKRITAITEAQIDS